MQIACFLKQLILLVKLQTTTNKQMDVAEVCNYIWCPSKFRHHSTTLYGVRSQKTIIRTLSIVFKLLAISRHLYLFPGMDTSPKNKFILPL